MPLLLFRSATGALGQAVPQFLRILLDDFNRSNEGPPPSNNWTNGISTFVSGEGLVVTGNTAARAATGGYRQGSYWSAGSFGANVELAVEVSDWTNTTSNGLALFLRLATIGTSSTDGYALAIERSSTATTWYIWRYDNGVATSLGLGTSQAVVAGDLVAFQAIGSELRGYIRTAGSWTLVISASDSTYSSAGNVGIEVLNNQQTKITNSWAASLPSSAQSFVTIRPSD